MNAEQLTLLVVRPTLKTMGKYSLAAERLIVGTIYQESLKGHYLKQVGGGPALGVIQMEPVTYHDIWDNYLAFRRDLANTVTALASLESTGENLRPDVSELMFNIRFAVAMCRVHYLRVPAALPAADDIHGLGEYWKAHYNTELGKGTVEEFVEKFPRDILHL